MSQGTPQPSPVAASSVCSLRGSAAWHSNPELSTVTPTYRPVLAGYPEGELAGDRDVRNYAVDPSPPVSAALVFEASP